MSVWSVTHTGHPGPDTRRISRGSNDRIPVRKSSTVWVPHSYPACSQHAPNEHVLPALMREGLGMTAALLWQVGAQAAVLPRRRTAA